LAHITERDVRLFYGRGMAALLSCDGGYSGGGLAGFCFMALGELPESLVSPCWASHFFQTPKK
jgi:hypothetical protein